MPPEGAVALVILILTYVGVAVGRIPGLRLDRAGIAFLGGAAMIAVGPLSLEEAFRLKAGSRTVVRGSFVSHWLHQVLYWDVSWHTLLAIYVLFLGLVVLTFFYIKPRRRSPCAGSGDPAYIFPAGRVLSRGSA